MFFPRLTHRANNPTAIFGIVVQVGAVDNTAHSRYPGFTLPVPVPVSVPLLVYR
jgi:hypothetical protein